MSEQAILQSDPKAGYLAHREAIDRAIADTLAGGWYILGQEVSAFESEFAEYLGAGFAIGVANGTDAISLSLRCLVKAGDLVIVPSHTAVATIVAVEMAGAAPLFVDIDPASYTLDPQLVEAAIGDFKDKTAIRALLPVHLYGHPAALEELRELAERHSLAVIEDCAQAHGATLRNLKVGTFGQMAAFSFYPTKNLGALGDGGAIVTSDPALARQAASLREYGWRERYVSQTPGMNSRLDELQAAILRIKLRALDAENQRRSQIAAIYDDGLSDLPLDLPQHHEAVSHVYHQYVIRCDNRDALREHLRACEIGSLIHYPVPVHQQPAYQNRYPIHRNRLPVTESIAARILSLPMHPFLSENQATRVCQAIRAWFHG